MPGLLSLLLDAPNPNALAMLCDKHVALKGGVLDPHCIALVQTDRATGTLHPDLSVTKRIHRTLLVSNAHRGYLCFKINYFVEVKMPPFVVFGGG